MPNKNHEGKVLSKVIESRVLKYPYATKFDAHIISGLS